MAKKRLQSENKTVRASSRGLHVAPRKMRLLTNSVKNLPVSEAITQLQFSHKGGAQQLIKLIRSAVANAENNHSLNADQLFIKSITADMGQTMKRYFPRARGSAFIIRRKLSHLNVVLEERTASKKAAKRSRLLSFRKQSEPVQTQEGNVGNPDAVEQTNDEQQPENKPATFGKTNEQVKMNRQQQKRRLFNRRTGE